MTREIECRNGRCYESGVTAKDKIKLAFNRNPESDQIELEMLEKEIGEE